MRQTRRALTRWSRSLYRMVPLVALMGGCSAPEPEPVTISLVDGFSQATIENAIEAVAEPPRVEWTFDTDPGPQAPENLKPTFGWESLHGISGLTVRDGKLTGMARDRGVVVVAVPGPVDETDFFHALEIDLKVSEGGRLGVSFEGGEELERERVIDQTKKDIHMAFNTDLIVGEESQTYTLTGANASFSTSVPMSRIRFIVLRPSDAEQAEFEISSVRLISLKEHLAAIPSGIGWQGLSDVFRETVVARSPEEIIFDLKLPADPFLDLSVGTVENGAVTFVVEADAAGERSTLLKRTVTTPQTWYATPVELRELAGQQVRLSLKVEADVLGTIGFWGSPVVRNRAGQVEQTESSPARQAGVGGDRKPPQGVILIIADTLRRDHLEFYGYQRETSPVLASLATDGALFLDNISQGTWTKVSVSSIMTSLYPATTGIKDMPDRLPASVTTLAEAYRTAGYATFATSSVPFTGRLTNLHQGVEVLHERSSLPPVEPSSSKTARTYTDRLLDWIEIQQDVPFFAFLHVFDPHSPFEPYRPYESMFMTADEMAAFRADLAKALEGEEDQFMVRQVLPTLEALEKAGIDVPTFIQREKDWYDASIRAMDVEIGRLMERLDQLGLAVNFVIAFMSDHGEEFLEHGKQFHGYNAYGEMLNVPLFFWGPSWVPSGVVVEETVQSIDVMPTLMEISRLPLPDAIQGQSLLSLLVDGNPTTLGWTPRPAFAERAYAPEAFEDDEEPLDSIVIVSDGWKLIRNFMRPEGIPEYELFNHVEDPLNLVNVADQHPEIVERLKPILNNWHEAALAARLDPESEADMSAEELQQLKALGYLQ